MKKLMKKQTLLLYSLVLLIGCQQDKDDLQAYINGVKLRQQADITPISITSAYRHSEYTMADRRDPFTPFIHDVMDSLTTSNLSVQPDSERSRQVLEFYDLSSLNYVGTLDKEQRWALIRTPEGQIYPLRYGDYMGRNHGMIIAITDTAVRVNEILSDGSDGFIERDTVVSIIEVN